MLVMTLLAMTLGVVGFKIPKAIRTQQYLNETRLLLDTLITAQELMVSFDADVTLSLKKEEKGYSTYISCTSEVPDKMFKKIPHPSFRKIEKILWNGQEDKEVTLIFSSSQGGISKGELTLMGVKKVMFFLPGFPARIVKKSYA